MMKLESLEMVGPHGGGEKAAVHATSGQTHDLRKTESERQQDSGKLGTHCQIHWTSNSTNMYFHILQGLEFLELIRYKPTLVGWNT